ncbi:unnamed protein product [Spirodela intermedia]|uniref:histone acetyltransferase n=1 Tax=Spirodela intermedia TaxID=51605 RepID=A0A7I8ITM3_SPIIN|nr:unnamed protein product [Spirodela intermedia]CAA6660968.1 unnamed protein product [Spirodela intermedia]
MALKRREEEPSGDKKKKKRVGFSAIDSGIEANECIKIFLVRSEEEVGASSHNTVDPVDLNQFFGEDGKIYGYKGLKINVWLSIISFHACAEITFETSVDGGKGITDLEPCLQKLFGESLLEMKEFLQSFSSECQYIRNVVSNGTVVLCKAGEEDDTGSTIEVIRMGLNNLPVGTLYSRLVPLVLLFVEGSVDITDPGWDIYFVVKKTSDQTGDTLIELLGFATVYRFYHYPDSTRLRISQILVLPPYQGQGHGRHLIESVNSIAISENLHDVTAEEPSDYLQHLRLCMDSLRLLTFSPVRTAVTSAAAHLQEVNPPRKPAKPSYWVSDRVRDEILGKDFGGKEKQLVEVPNDYNPEMSFVVFMSQDGSEGSGRGQEQDQEELLNKVVDEEMEEIAEIAKRVSSLRETRRYFIF